MVGGISLLQLALKRGQVNQERKRNMLKNMTRKGLALGTGLALVATGFVGAPAQATATGQLWSAFGQTNEMVGVAGHNFTLRVGTPSNLTSTSGTGADANARQANARASVAGKVSVTWVPASGKTAPTITVSAADSPSGSPAANTVLAIVDTTSSDASNVGTALVDGNIVLVAPSTLDYSMQVDVQVTYNDGSRSEVERITFVPQKDVRTTLTLNSLFVGQGDNTGAISFTGINTENFVRSNFSGGVTNGTAAAADNVRVQLRQGTTDRAIGTIAYDSLTDRYNLTATGITEAAGDVFELRSWIGASAEANAYFETGATAATVTSTVSAASSYAAMDISVNRSTSLTQNTSGSATSLVTAETIVAAEGTKSITFLISLFSDANMTTAAGANHEVTVTLTDTGNKLGTTTITTEGRSLNVTGSSISFMKRTNSVGQISFTVTANNAVAGEEFTIDAVSGLGASVDLDTTTVKWEKPTFTVLPAVDGNFTIAPKGSVSLDYRVVDQFGNNAGTDFQLAFTRAPGAGDRDTAAEYANWSYVAPVSATGTSSVTLVDNGAAVEGRDTVTATLQKRATGGTAFITEANSVSDTFVLIYENDMTGIASTARVSYNGITNAAGDVIAPIYLETDPLVNFDSRISASRAAVSLWDANNVENDGLVANSSDTPDSLLRVFGTVTNGTAVVAGVAVRLSATGLNFADNAATGSMTRASNDSFVVFTDSTGSYEAFVRGSAAGTQTISVDAQGAKSSVQVRFQESTGVARTMTLAMPSSVNSGARADIVATVVDRFGKPVSGVTVNFKDNGPGVLNASSAVTDIFGEAMVTLTTVAAESGTTTVTAFATIAGKNEVATKTIAVGSGAAAGAGKVNVGSFNGRLVVYASGLNGKRISWKVGGRWGSAVADSNFDSFSRPTPRAGATVNVEVYVDGVKALTKSVVTR